jgi:hypothetical protein
VAKNATKGGNRLLSGLPSSNRAGFVVPVTEV